ncbi:uncharacterized protein LOC132203173 isoform X2 [Neocloeon triangulifer]|nr:uncharacterized protein LOC132203173 isoform X2 [Neocloeon triangulifer]XP_059486716.1 uncharacterized protein LOC132203173 isoform X2 [Neocloeon triangulifer]XP_059486717.1 uncharacterized protein LOC132203173 isoform X2 [Neocloeon triangulifer]
MASSSLNNQYINDQMELDELAVLNDLNDMKRTLMDCGHRNDELRIKASELLAEMAVLHDPKMDLKRFNYLEFLDDIEITALKIDSPEVQAVLDAESKEDQRVG